MDKIERRTLSSELEIRATDKGPNKLVGYAAKFDQLSEDLGGFVEVIRQGAFSRTLKENPDVRALFNHDKNFVLGRTKSGTLRLEEDKIGLRFELDLPDTQVARDLKVSVARGDFDGCSFMFIPVDMDRQSRANDLPLQEVRDLDLIEISPCVTFPAYSQTEVKLREKPASTPKLDNAKRILEIEKHR